MNVTSMVITVVGGIALFLFGMKLMSEGLQKVAGPKMRKILSAMTGNRLAGVGTGLTVTCAVQSSSATTVMLVSFVSAGLITLEQSVGVVMGANIGTTITGWLVALLGFKIKIAAMALPAIAIGFFPRLIGARKAAEWGEVLLGFGILFLGLGFMKDSVGQLKESEAILQWMAATRADVLPWRLAAVAVGAIVTMLVQSSSATMAITMTLAAQGMIDLPTACALVLGENIGTTITANIAAIGASISARRTAIVHLMFNVTGALWAVLLFNPFLSFVESILPGSAAATGGELTQAGIAARLAAFHTVFNLINTSIFLPFTRQLAWLSTQVVRGEDKEAAAALRYLSPHIVETPPLALHAAKNEIGRMIDEVESMLKSVMQLIVAPDQKLGKTADAILRSEQTVDYLEKEITEYMVALGRLEVSLEQSHEIAGLLHTVADLERMGDHCESLTKLLAKRYDKKMDLPDRAIKELTEIGNEVGRFIELIRSNLFEAGEQLMPNARQVEEKINAMRKQMRKGHIERLNSGACAVDAGLIFIDMLTSFEKMGDHAYNVAQVLAGER